MKNWGILTFHASHNYGSCLQAYALQTALDNLGAENEIINFRTDRQKDLYAIFTKRKGVKYWIKNCAHLLYYKSLKYKYNNFENFINNDLKLSSKEYQTINDLKDANFSYKGIIAGSDQIWNPVPADFDWAYYLPFIKEIKKISYAPSLGQLLSTGDNETKKRIAQYIQDFSNLSVREIGAAKAIEKIAQRQAEIVLDPTLLLSKEKWENVIEKQSIVNGKYIFLYTLFSTPVINKIAKRVAKRLKMPIVVSNFSNQYDVFTSFKKKYMAGPKEFLNLIYNAKLVLTTSFHGTAFSINLKKPFLAIGGEKDARICNILSLTGLNNRTISMDDFDEKMEKVFDLNWEETDRLLEKEREKSLAFLKNALDL